MNKKNAVIACISLGLALPQPIGALGRESELTLLTHHESSSPVEILGASIDQQARQLAVTVRNDSAAPIAGVALVARTFDDMARTGGMYFRSSARVEAGGYADLIFGMEAPIPRGSTRALLTVSEVFAFDESGAGITSLWRHHAPPPEMDPSRIEGLELGLQPDLVTVSPALVSGCCDDCRSTAEGCGKNQFANGCRGVCVSNYSCTYTHSGGECQNVQCTFQCKPVGSCC